MTYFIINTERNYFEKFKNNFIRNAKIVKIRMNKILNVY